MASAVAHQHQCRRQPRRHHATLRGELVYRGGEEYPLVDNLKVEYLSIIFAD